MTDKNLAATINVIRYRQTYNQYSKNWQVPKHEKDGKWVAVKKAHLVPVITHTDGYRYALWRMRTVMINIKDKYSRKVWKVNNISTRYMTVKGVKYSIFQFDCHRVAHGIIGGMNTQGGN